MNKDSILESVKKTLNLCEDDMSFDQDIIMHINSVFANLTQIGVGPKEGFSIEDESSLWSDFIGDSKVLQNVKSFMYVKVRILFDPPANATLMEALNANAKEFEWRLSVTAEQKKEETPKKELKKQGPYLYSVEYTDLDYAKAEKWIREHFAPIGGCSVVRKGNLVLRQLDWYYNYEAKVYVKVNATKDHYKSHGIVDAIPELTVDRIDAGDINEMYDIIPFLMSEGENEYKLHVATNVVYLEEGEAPTTGTIPLIETKESVCMSTLCRYILDNFKSVAAATLYIKNYVSVYANKRLSDLGMGAHFILSDENGSWVMEFNGNQIKIEPFNKMTNFKQCGIIPNLDGKVYTPSTQDATHNAFDTNKIGLLGMGLERWNLIVENYPNLNSKEDMIALGLNILDYERSYTIENPQDIWYTEFVGANSRGYLTVKSPVSDYSYIIAASRERYAHKDRSQDKNGVWCTAHTTVYDLDEKAMYVYITSFSKSKEYKFVL